MSPSSQSMGRPLPLPDRLSSLGSALPHPGEPIPVSKRGAGPSWRLQEEGVDCGALAISGFPPQGPLVEGYVWGGTGDVEADFEQRSALS